jgi:hypothetical protein
MRLAVFVKAVLSFLSLGENLSRALVLRIGKLDLSLGFFKSLYFLS